MTLVRLNETLDGDSGVYFEGTLVEAVQTEYQLIEVFDTAALGKLMRIDGANMTSERDEFFYHENLVHPAAIAHGDPRNVLIIGGGDGGSSEEILKHPSVKRVVLVELDEAVIKMAKRHLNAVHHDVFDNPKLEVRIMDGGTFVRETQERFDLIFLDLTDPTGPAAALYTEVSFVALKGALISGGALVLHMGSPFSHPQRVADTVASLRSVFTRTTPYFVHIPTYGSQWGFAIASDNLDIDITAAEVERRLNDRNISDRRFYNGEMHCAMLALPEYVKALIG